MSYSEDFLIDVKRSIDNLSLIDIDSMVDLLVTSCDVGRLFIIGSGGGAGHASHAVCDFRKLCNCEAYAPYDNVSELTARANDEGWNTTIIEWLKVSKFDGYDTLMVISVGGGQTGVSENLVNAILYAKEKGAKVCSVIGRKDSIAGQYSDVSIVIQTENTTPIVEGLQAVIWHLIVTHPKLKKSATKW